jgi:Effector protein
MREQLHGPGEGQGVARQALSGGQALGSEPAHASLLRLQRLAGNTATTQLVQRQHAHSAASRVRSLPFARFRVVSDGARVRQSGGLETLHQSEFDELAAAWRTLSDPTDTSSSLRLHEEGDMMRPAVTAPGFRNQLLAAVGQLLAHRHGRELVLGIMHGSQIVQVRPWTGHERDRAETQSTTAGEIRPGGQAGPGAGSTIMLDPTLVSNEPVGYDESGRALRSPLFITLGHELIHALHNAHGTALHQDDGSPSEPEEDATIQGPSPDVTENDLRHEHHLPNRHGHLPYWNLPTAGGSSPRRPL